MLYYTKLLSKMQYQNIFAIVTANRNWK